MKRKQPHRQAWLRRGTERAGAVLITCLLLALALTLAAATVFPLSLAGLRGAGYQTRERRAFYQAEAGIRYAMSCINRDIAAGTLALTAAVVNVAYAAPSGYEFDTITALNRMPNGKWYNFVVTGRCVTSRAVIEATVSRPQLLKTMGVFGDVQSQLQPNIDVYSYSSLFLLNPVAADSTGEANVGSNESIVLRPGAFVDGMFLLGASQGGVPPSAPGGSFESVYVGRIPPDPLGATSGALAQAFAHFSIATNNQNAREGIVGNQLSLGAGGTFTLHGGNYYLTKFYMPARSTLVVDATRTNPTVIYLSGEMKMQPNTDINMTAGQPANFFIFSNSTQPVDVQPNGDFRAFLYAPFADVDLKPNGRMMGVFWGNDITLLPGQDVFVDVSLLDTFVAGQVKLEQWRQVIN